jgi:hypothetical protein
VNEGVGDECPLTSDTCARAPAKRRASTAKRRPKRDIGQRERRRRGCTSNARMEEESIGLKRWEKVDEDETRIRGRYAVTSAEPLRRGPSAGVQ